LPTLLAGFELKLRLELVPTVGENYGFPCRAIEYADIVEVFRKTYQHECEVTESINALVDTAFQEKDYSTFNFLQWYVAEQHEEEKLFKDILDKIEMIGMDGKGLFYIDRELAQLATEKMTDSKEA